MSDKDYRPGASVPIEPDPNWPPDPDAPTKKEGTHA